MADIPDDITFPPSLAELYARQAPIAPTQTAQTLVELAAPQIAAVEVQAPLSSRAFADSPTPQPQPLTDADHVAPVEGTLEFSPAFDEIEDLVDLWYLIHPDIPLYKWQEEELLRVSGYVDGTRKSERIHYDPKRAFRGAYCCANGSGKDLALIATIAIGLPLLYKNVIVVITSASHEQLKFQTENHIERGLAGLHARLGFNVYTSVKFYHRCESRGGEIKLFCTDEGKRAEGWHPFHPNGRLVLIINEAKSIPDEIHQAFDRCDGYSHWLEVSSPGPREGLFYDNYMNAVKHPNLPVRGEFYARKVSYRECPHKSEETRLQMIRKVGEFSFTYQTSYEANFWEPEEDVCVPASLLEPVRIIIPRYDAYDIGIGLDSAAGRDENTMYVRAGAKLIFKKEFIQKDTEDAADIIDAELAEWKRVHYTFNADDGGVSRGICDKLKRRGWDVHRRLNQSPSHNPALYLNLGAEMYFHVAKLLSLKLICPPNDPILINQLTTRRYSEKGHQGKKALQPKKELSKSPDRSDGYVLCYFSYRPPELKADVAKLPEEKKMMTIAEFEKLCELDPEYLPRLLKQHDTKPQPKDAAFTFQTVKI